MKIGSLDRTATFSWCPTTYPPLLAIGTAAGAMDSSFSATTELEIFELDGAFKKKGSLMVNARFNHLSWSAAGMLAGGKENGEVDVYNPRAIVEKLPDELLARHTVFSGPVNGLDFSSVNPSLLAAGGPEGEVLIFDLNSGVKPYRPYSKPTRADDVTALSWNQVADYILAVGSISGSTGVYDLRGKREIMKLAYPGGRRKVTGISWHPSTPTRLVTVNDDDNSPCVLIWDLRNASAPELTLSGHDKGILSVQWCKMDPDLIISTSKDNRTLLWDVSLAAPIGDLCQSRNWTFNAQWCPRNPDMIAVSSFDGTVSIHSLQAQGVTPYEYESSQTPELQKMKPDPNDIFSMIGRNQPRHSTETSNGLILERPPKWLRRPNGVSWAFGGKLVSFSGNKSMISVPVIDPTIMTRVDMLHNIVRSDDVEQFKNFCDLLSNSDNNSFNSQDRETWDFLKVMFEKSREHMHDFLGLTDDPVITESISKIQQRLDSKRDDEMNSLPKGPSKFSLYVSGKGNDAEIDNLITRLCVTGEFEKAVDACIAYDRWADALVIAVSGGPDLLRNTQKQYFNRRKSEKSYIKLLEAVVDSNFEDVVCNVLIDMEKNEWKDILGFISTFASSEELSREFSIFGHRLSEECASPQGDMSLNRRQICYHAAALSFIGAGDLENAVKLWIRREQEEESTLLDQKHAPSRLINHFVALQSLVEKIIVLRKAIHYFDPYINQPLGEGDVYPLHMLYSHFLEYSEILSVLGRPEFAWNHLQLVPESFQLLDVSGSDVDPVAAMRDRLYRSLAITDNKVPKFPFQSIKIISQEETAEIQAREATKNLNLPRSSSQPLNTHYGAAGGYGGAAYQSTYPQYQQTHDSSAGYRPYNPSSYGQTGAPGNLNSQFNPPQIAPYPLPGSKQSGPGLFNPPPISAPARSMAVGNPSILAPEVSKPWVPPVPVKSMNPPVFTPPTTGLPQTTRNSFTGTIPGVIGPPPVMHGINANQRPPMNPSPPMMNQSPPTMNGMPPNQGSSVINQRATIQQGPPIMAPPPMNQGPPVMQRPPISQGPPVMQRPPISQGPPVMQAPPVGQGPPIMQRPAINQGPPVMQAPPVSQGPPIMQRPPTINQGPLAVQRPPISQGPLVTQGSPITQGPPVIQRPPMTPGSQVFPVPQATERPPVSQGSARTQESAGVQSTSINQVPPAQDRQSNNQDSQMINGHIMSHGPSIPQNPSVNKGFPFNHRQSEISGSSFNQGSQMISDSKSMKQQAPAIDEQAKLNFPPQGSLQNQNYAINQGPPTTNSASAGVNPQQSTTGRLNPGVASHYNPQRIDLEPENSFGNSTVKTEQSKTGTSELTSHASQPPQSNAVKLSSEPSNIISGFENQIFMLKGNGDMSQKRMLEDAERRLKTLFEQLRTNQLPEDILAALANIVHALESRDFARSSQIQIDLMTRRFDKTGAWIMGIKRIIDATEKLQLGQGQSLNR